MKTEIPDNPSFLCYARGERRRTMPAKRYKFDSLILLSLQGVFFLVALLVPLALRSYLTGGFNDVTGQSNVWVVAVATLLVLYFVFFIAYPLGRLTLYLPAVLTYLFSINSRDARRYIGSGLFTRYTADEISRFSNALRGRDVLVNASTACKELVHRFGLDWLMRLSLELPQDELSCILSKGLPEIISEIQEPSDLINARLLCEGLGRAQLRLASNLPRTRLYEGWKETAEGSAYKSEGGQYRTTSSREGPIPGDRRIQRAIDDLEPAKDALRASNLW
ncbi:MAG: hypothetical protein LAO04_20830 [Acidobacteriia bacterium]|nr:hypothetical protein [Terriglobia bacterium]